MNLIRIWWVVIGLALLWSVYLGIKKHRLIYELKVWLNGLKPAIAMMWSAYFLVAGVSLMPYITEWVDNVAVVSTHSEGVALIQYIPSMYLFTIIYIIIRTIASANTPFVKYKDQELIWEQESSKRGKEMAMKLMFWKRGKDNAKV